MEDQLVCEECGETLDYESNQYQYDCPECHAKGSLVRDQQEDGQQNEDEVFAQISVSSGLENKCAIRTVDSEELTVSVSTDQYSGDEYLAIQTGEDQKDCGIIHDAEPGDLETGRWYWVKSKAGDINQPKPFRLYEKAITEKRDVFVFESGLTCIDLEAVEAVKPISESPWQDGS